MVIRDLNNKEIISVNRKKDIASLHHSPPLLRMTIKWKARLLKCTKLLNLWHEVVSNDYKLDPFLTLSDNIPFGILKVPLKIPS